MKKPTTPFSFYDRKTHRLVWTTIWTGCILYFSTLFYIVFAARRRIGVDHVLMRSYLNLAPLKHTLTYDHQESYYDFYSNLIGNIVMFIPFPLILIYVCRFKKFGGPIVIPIVTSVLIETLQYCFGIGIADINDVILNTTGTILGVFFSVLLDKKLAISRSN